MSEASTSSASKAVDVTENIHEMAQLPRGKHLMGQFYTPPFIAEFIVRWAIQNPSDTVLDPGVGDGVFLIEAYKRLFELKTHRKYGEVTPNSDIHVEILRQIYGFDIDPIATQLTAQNLMKLGPSVSGAVVNIYNTDFFAIRPGQKMLIAIIDKASAGAVPQKFDVIIGNPPYTRWSEISPKTREAIRKVLTPLMKKYGLEPWARRGGETAMYVYWIMHATNFLKEGGRLGMIISNLWLQSMYGIRFGNFLLDHYRIHAIIDITTQLFSALITTCIILAEKESDPKKRAENEVLFIHIPGNVENIDVEEIFKAIEMRQSSKYYVKVVRQGDIPKDRKWFDIFYGIERIRAIYKHMYFIRLGDLFEVAPGNTVWAFWAAAHARWANIGSTNFHYLSPSKLRVYGLEKYAYPNMELKDAIIWPAVVSARQARYFTFTKEDWEKLYKEDKKCYMFIGHVPRDNMPPEVAEYVKLGETTIRSKIKMNQGGGKLSSETLAAKIRTEAKDTFYGWYDLGGVLFTPIFVTQNAWYKVRFIEMQFPVALSDNTFAFLPKTELSQSQIKALLAYLNSSYMQYYLEIQSRKSGGGALGLDNGPLKDAPILDVKKLPKDAIEKLAKLFNELEAEARKMNGIATREEFEHLKPKIHEIDRAIAEILGVDKDVATEVEKAVDFLISRRTYRNGHS